MKKLLCFVLTAVLLATSVVPTFAMSETSWDSVWSSADAEAGLIMFVGSDESERNFTWYTEEQNTPSVVVSTNGMLTDSEKFEGTSVKATEGDFANHVTVTELEEDTVYYYKCISGDYESDVYSFRTASDDEFKAVYMTDIHITQNSDENPYSLKNTSYNLNNALEDALSKESDISLLLSTGDQASDGLECEYKAFAASPLLKSISVATTIGNHDLKGAEYKTFSNLPNEYEKAAVSSYIGDDYWFVKGDVLFLVVDSNNASGADHYKFVKKAVESNPDVKWKVMMAHHDLYSGRIPHRESENELLRLIWAPIVDEFGIDLVLLGHSHYYTVSNVLFNNKIVAPLESEMVDPNGTIYMVSCSINRPRGDDEIGLNEEIGFDYLTEEPTYNILTCSEDSITVESYEVGDEEPFNSYTITKTTKDGGYEKGTSFFLNLFNRLVRFIGKIVAFFGNIGRLYDLREDGFDVKIIDGLLGR
ncbi:MAG: metallophosphoesterase family protein [Acutalibacteraceae bacterium]|nr:metallophosphoesterase family protein [Acutalibacteraceae bacterium]